MANGPKARVEAASESAAAQLLRQRDITPLSMSESSGLLRMEIGIPGLTGRTTCGIWLCSPGSSRR